MDGGSEAVDCGAQRTRHCRCCDCQETQIGHEGCIMVVCTSPYFACSPTCDQSQTCNTKIEQLGFQKHCYLHHKTNYYKNNSFHLLVYTILRKLPYKLFHSTYRCRSALLTLGKTLSKAPSKCSREIAGMVLALMEDRLPWDCMATSRTGPMEASWHRDRMSAPVVCLAQKS